MFDRKLLWRATDFWREGLRPEWKSRIARYNTWQDRERALPEDSLEYERIDKARTTPTESLPADFFTDVQGWWWFVKVYIFYYRTTTTLGDLYYGLIHYKFPKFLFIYFEFILY